MNPSIFIAIPHKGNIRFDHLPNIIEWSKKYPIALGNSTMYPIAGARNELVEFFLKTACTHILFLDSDTIMPRDGLPRLLSHGKDVISGIYALRVGEQKIAVSACRATHSNPPYETIKIPQELSKVDAVGAGCLLVKRSVFSRIKKPFFNSTSEDFYFCENCRKHGIDIWIDPTIKAKHFKEIAIELP